MPKSIDAYFQFLLEIIASSPVTRTENISLDKRSSSTGFVRGEIYCIDGSELHFRELVQIKDTPARIMYAYHYQGKDKKLIFRFDNTEHFPDLSNFPHHKHLPDQVLAIQGEPPDLEEVLNQMAKIINA